MITPDDDTDFSARTQALTAAGRNRVTARTASCE
jgi:hypothetical protein